MESNNVKSLHLITDEDRSKYITQLKQLIKHPGWNLIKNQLLMLRNEAEEEIFKIGQDSTPKYTDSEILRRERAYILAIENFPDQLLHFLTQRSKEEATPDIFDPYEDSSHKDYYIPEDQI